MSSYLKRIYIRQDQKPGFSLPVEVLIDAVSAGVFFVAAYMVDDYWEYDHANLLPYLIAMLLGSRFRGKFSGFIVLLAALIMPYARGSHDLKTVLTFIVAGLCSIYVGNGFLTESIAKRKANEALNRARREQELREQMVASLAHDLRNPLTAAKVASQVLNYQTQNVTMIRLSSAITVNLDKIDERLTDMLDASRLASGEALAISIAACDLFSISKDSLERMAMIYGDRFELQCSMPKIEGLWDKKAVGRILENLLGNAVKYGDSSRRIKLEVLDRVSEVDLNVTNFGKPIDHRQDLFQLYSREANAAEKPGWGIGLSVVKGLTEAHGGRVAIETGTDWTKFTITLPRDNRVA